MNFAHEYSVILCRGQDGSIVDWPVPVNLHKGGILATSTLPPPALVRAQAAEAVQLARTVAEKLDHIGVLTAEFFACKDGPRFNEIAPRVHNSGHWTIEGSATSQFENHVRAVVVLPDGGARDLSKAFNDNWMREHGFLEAEMSLGRVRELVENKGAARDLIVASPRQRVAEVIGLMKIHGVSQVPVVHDGKVVGVLHESRLLERALDTAVSQRGSGDVGELAEANFCTVDADTDVGVLTELFKRAKVAFLIGPDGRPLDIITRIDLIDYISNVTHAARERP